MWSETWPVSTSTGTPTQPHDSPRPPSPNPSGPLSGCNWQKAGLRLTSGPAPHGHTWATCLPVGSCPPGPCSRAVLGPSRAFPGTRLGLEPPVSPKVPLGRPPPLPRFCRPRSRVPIHSPVGGGRGAVPSTSFKSAISPKPNPGISGAQTRTKHPGWPLTGILINSGGPCGKKLSFTALGLMGEKKQKAKTISCTSF